MSKICYINGISYLVTLPTGGYLKNNHNNQWDHLLNYLNLQGQDLDCINWRNIFSWCQERDYRSRCSVRGFYSSCTWADESSDFQTAHIGFRPVFVPLNPTTLQPDPSVLKELSNGQCVRFGSFYLDKKIMRPPQEPTRDGDIPDYIPGADISFGSLKSEYGFKAIKINDWLIADRVLIKNISWNDLKNLGYAD